jgi:hypothetical protein
VVACAAVSASFAVIICFTSLMPFLWDPSLNRDWTGLLLGSFFIFRIFSQSGLLATACWGWLVSFRHLMHARFRHTWHSMNL